MRSRHHPRYGDGFAPQSRLSYALESYLEMFPALWLALIVLIIGSLALYCHTPTSRETRYDRRAAAYEQALADGCSYSEAERMAEDVW